VEPRHTLDCQPRQRATVDHPKRTGRISYTCGEESETVPALKNSCRRKKLVGQDNQKVVSKDNHVKDIIQNIMPKIIKY